MRIEKERTAASELVDRPQGQFHTGRHMLDPKQPTLGGWDAHGGLKENHGKNALAVDQPIGGLLEDLDRRGLLEETIVIFCTEFGRTPGSQGSDGRDHHPFAFSVWMAGGNVRWLTWPVCLWRRICFVPPSGIRSSLISV